MADTTVQKTFKQKTDLNTIFHSAEQLKLLLKRTKYLKNYFCQVSYQNLCYGLKSLVLGNNSVPVVRFESSFILHIDNLRTSLYFMPTERLFFLIKLCSELLSINSSHEVLLCDALDSIYSEKNYKINEHFDNYLMYVLSSIQPELIEYINSLPSSARLIPKLQNVLKVKKINTYDNIPNISLKYNSLLYIIENNKWMNIDNFITYVNDNEKRFNSLFDNSIQIPYQFIDFYFLMFFHLKDKTVNYLNTIMDNIFNEIINIINISNNINTRSNDWKIDLILSIIDIFTQLFLLSLQHNFFLNEEDCNNLINSFKFLCNEYFPFLHKDSIDKFPYIINVINIIIDINRRNYSLKEYITWDNLYNDFITDLNLQDILKTLTISMYPIECWLELYKSVRYEVTGIFTSSIYDGCITKKDIPEFVNVMENFRKKLQIDSYDNLASNLQEIVQFHIFTGSSAKSTLYYFNSHLSLPFKELDEINFPLNIKIKVIKNIIDTSVRTIGVGLCRMKISVIHLPVIIKGICNFNKNQETNEYNYKYIEEQLDAFVQSVNGATSRGSNPEYLLSCFVNLLNIAQEHDKLLHLLTILPERFETHGSYEKLLHLQYTYDICIGKMKIPRDLVSNRLLSMIATGQRRDVGKLWSLFRGDFFSSKYDTVRTLLFQKSPEFSGQEISKILSLLIEFRDVTNYTCEPVIQTYSTLLLGKLSQELLHIIINPKQTFSTKIMQKYLYLLNTLTLYQHIFPQKLRETEKIFFPTTIKEEEKEEDKEEDKEDNNDNNEQSNEDNKKEENNEPIIHICSNEKEFEEYMNIELGVKLFPKDIVNDNYILHAVLVAAQRIKTIRHDRPKYNHVCDTAQRILEYFFSCISNEEYNKMNSQEILQCRKLRLKQYILELNENKNLIEHLQKFGYKDIWNDDLYIIIEMKLHSDAEETFYFSILDNYRKLVYLLTDLGLKKIEGLEGEEINVEHGSVFNVDMTLQELEIRKAVVTNAIKQAPNNTCACACAKDYQVQEDQIRSDYLEKLREQKKIEQLDNVTKKFVMRIHNSFFHSITMCPKQGGLAECYAATGIHAEKPLENGLKVNSKFVSIYEHKETNKNKTQVVGDVIGEQLENAEIIYTDQGLYFYKVYTKGHTFDTSELWASFIKSLLTSNLVPAVILAEGFPNSRSFNYLSRQITPEIYGTMLNFRDDFFSKEGISSYYDFHPEKIKIGDLLITEDKISSLKLPQSTIISPTPDDIFLRNSNALILPEKTISSDSNNKTQQKKKIKKQQKDFCGYIISKVITKVNESNDLLEYRQTLFAWAKFISELVNNFISNGELDLNILYNGFNLKRYNARVKKSKKKNNKAKILTEDDKQFIINHLIKYFSLTITEYYTTDENKLQTLYNEQRLYYYDLRNHLEKLIYVLRNNNNSSELLTGIDRKQFQYQLQIMRNQLQCDSTLTSIPLLSVLSQEQLLRWCFWNEDKVWRYRGGRTETTVNDFLRFISPPKYPSYPGTCVIDSKDNKSNELETLIECENRVIAYAIGEFIDENTYEIVTAYSNSKYSHLNLAIMMYLRIMKELYDNYECKILVMDIKKGAYDKIISSSSLLSFICKIKLDKYILLKLEDSYEQKLHGGQIEKFQRVEIYLPTIVRIMRFYNIFLKITNKQNKTNLITSPAYKVSKNNIRTKKSNITSILKIIITTSAITLPLYFIRK